MSADKDMQQLFGLVFIAIPGLTLGFAVVDLWNLLASAGPIVAACAWILAGVAPIGAFAAYAALNDRLAHLAWPYSVGCRFAGMWIMIAAGLLACGIALAAANSARNVGAGFAVVEDHLWIALSVLWLCEAVVVRARMRGGSDGPHVRVARFGGAASLLLLAAYAALGAAVAFASESQLSTFLGAMGRWHERLDRVIAGLDIAAVVMLGAIMLALVRARERGLQTLERIWRTKRVLSVAALVVYVVSLVALSADPPLRRDAAIRLDQLRVARNRARTEDDYRAYLQRVARRHEPAAPPALRQQTAALLARTFEEELASSDTVRAAREGPGVASRIAAVRRLLRDPRVQKLIAPIRRPGPLSDLGNDVADALRNDFSSASASFWRAAAKAYHPPAHGTVDAELHVVLVTQALSLSFDHSVSLGDSLLDVVKSTYLTTVGEDVIHRYVFNAYEAFRARLIAAADGLPRSAASRSEGDYESAEDAREVGRAAAWICNAPNARVTRTNDEIRIAQGGQLTERDALAEIGKGEPGIRPGVDRPNEPAVEPVRARPEAIP